MFSKAKMFAYLESGICDMFIMQFIDLSDTNSLKIYFTTDKNSFSLNIEFSINS